MSGISGVKPQSTPQQQPTARAGTDADGDNDGTRAAKPAAPVPQVSKPTATLGNHVNTTA